MAMRASGTNSRGTFLLQTPRGSTSQAIIGCYLNLVHGLGTPTYPHGHLHGVNLTWCALLAGAHGMAPFVRVNGK